MASPNISRSPRDLVARGELLPDPMTLLSIVPGEKMSELQVTRLSNIGNTGRRPDVFWARKIQRELHEPSSRFGNQPFLHSQGFLWLPRSDIESFYARIAVREKLVQDRTDALYWDFPRLRFCSSFSRIDDTEPWIGTVTGAGIWKETNDWLQQPVDQPLDNQIVAGAPSIQEVLSSAGEILEKHCQVPANAVASLIGNLMICANLGGWDGRSPID